MSEKDMSITDALGLKESWKKRNTKLMIDALQRNDTVSQTIRETISRIKNEEFGEGNYEISDYEIKLCFAGYVMAGEMQEMQQKQVAAALLKHMMGMNPDNFKDDDEE